MNDKDLSRIDMTTKLLKKVLSEFFSSVQKVGGSSSAPILEMK